MAMEIKSKHSAEITEFSSVVDFAFANIDKYKDRKLYVRIVASLVQP